MDLNNPVDFAKSTMSPISGLLNSLTGAINANWDIQESAYGHPSYALKNPEDALIKFHIFKTASPHGAAVPRVEDIGGRRKVPFKYPYVDGQTTDDLGREGESFDFDILLYGPKYYDAYKILFEEFNNPIPGTLIHPVRGHIRCGAHEWRVTHSNEQVQAVAIHVKFIEHNFDASFADPKKTTKSALADAIAFFAKIDNVLTSIQSNINAALNFVKAIGAAIEAFKALFASNLSDLNRTFNPGTSSDLPGLFPTRNSGTFPNAQSPNDFMASVPDLSSATQTILASQQAKDQIIDLRKKANKLIAQIEAANGGQGALLFYAEIQTLRSSVVAMQTVLEIGLQSSQANLISYRTPLDMSMREVAFANGLDLSRVADLQILNPDILSHNYLPKGTLLLVPAA